MDGRQVREGGRVCASVRLSHSLMDLAVSCVLVLLHGNAVIKSELANGRPC